MLQAVLEENRRETDDGFLCLICNKLFNHHDKSRRHFRDNHWAEAPTYLCPGENYRSTSRYAFGEHIRNNHPEWKGVALDIFIEN